MDDNLDQTAAEQAEAAQSAVQEDAPTHEAPPPWGDDFDPSRAWNTITHLRGREKELESAAKTLDRLRSGEDREALKEIAEAYGFEVPEDEPDDDDEEYGENPYAKDIEELKQWREEERAARQVAAFRGQVNDLATSAEFELSDREIKWIFREAYDNGLTEDAIKAAFTEVHEAFAERDRRALEGYKSSKKAPPVAQSGKEATQVPDLDNETERHRWMVERMAANQQQ